MFFLLDTRFGTVGTQRKQVVCVLGEEPRQGHDVSVVCVCVCMSQGKHMQTCANVCPFTHYGQTKRTRANPLAVFFSLMTSALLWSPWASVQSLVSLQGMGRPRKVMFWGDIPGEAVSSLAAHFNPDLHGEETLRSAPRLQTSSSSPYAPHPKMGTCLIALQAHSPCQSAVCNLPWAQLLDSACSAPRRLGEPLLCQLCDQVPPLPSL